MCVFTAICRYPWFAIQTMLTASSASQHTSVNTDPAPSCCCDLQRLRPREKEAGWQHGVGDLPLSGEGA
jgi:hypothetical protein